MKRALYIDASNHTVAPLLHNPGYFSVPVHPEFHHQEFIFGDRAVIETDETKLQVLPYVNLLDDQGRVFCYSRGGAGDENRLHGALSIGLGGHVDSPRFIGEPLYDFLKEEAYRELNEEVGVTPRQYVLAPFTEFLIDRSNAVGKVHLGLRCVAVMCGNTQVTQEVGHIEGGFWKHPLEFTRDEYDRMENWSKLCLVRLVLAAKS